MHSYIRRLMPTIVCIVLCLTLLPLSAQEAPPVGIWKRLFNGKDLSGWHQIGSGDWSVEKGELVARLPADTQRGGWLLHEGNYADFYLKVKIKIENEGHSGILVRDPSHGTAKRLAFSGYEAQILNEADAMDPTGGFYGHQRAYLPEYTSNEWNQYEIRCIGDRLTYFLNGEKTADMHHRRSLHGAVGLQIMIGPGAAEFHFKDIEIIEFPQDAVLPPTLEERMEKASGDYIDLFAEKTLDDFILLWAGEWTFRNGILTGRRTEKISWIFTPEIFDNFILTAQFKTPEDGDGGIVVRFPPPITYGDTKKRPARAGYEIKIREISDPAYRHHAGGIEYLARSYPGQMKPNVWNDFKVYVYGERIIVYMNGTKTAETHSRYSSSGYIGYQVEQPHGIIQYRNVKVKPVQLPEPDDL